VSICPNPKGDDGDEFAARDLEVEIGGEIIIAEIDVIEHDHALAPPLSRSVMMAIEKSARMRAEPAAASMR